MERLSDFDGIFDLMDTFFDLTNYSTSPNYFVNVIDDGIQYMVPCIELDKEGVNVGLRNGKLEIKLLYTKTNKVYKEEKKVIIELNPKFDTTTLKASIKNGLLTLELKHKALQNIDITVE